MSILLSTPAAGEEHAVVRAVRGWQHDGLPIQLHPGDLGWYRRFGADATARAVRTWSRAGRVLAVGLLDGPGLVRLALDPAAQSDDELARQIVADVSDPAGGVLPPGDAAVEARLGDALRRLLIDAGWHTDEPWTPLRRALVDPVADCGLRVEVTGPEQAAVRSEVHRASFDGSTFTDEHWQAMAAGPAYADARCLVGYDDHDVPVAAATVWSAGPDRPGLLEPLGVHRDHRGRGHGVAITVAAAAALRSLGSSSALVCTPSSNVAAVAAYRSAGFVELPEVRDLRRPDRRSGQTGQRAGAAGRESTRDE